MRHTSERYSFSEWTTTEYHISHVELVSPAETSSQTVRQSRAERSWYPTDVISVRVLTRRRRNAENDRVATVHAFTDSRRLNALLTYWKRKRRVPHALRSKSARHNIIIIVVNILLSIRALRYVGTYNVLTCVPVTFRQYSAPNRSRRHVFRDRVFRKLSTWFFCFFVYLFFK